MSQQQTIQTLEQMVSSMSIEGQMTLAKIGLSWKDYAGEFGSLVYNSVLVKMLKEDMPWSVNKLTHKGQGRNGVVYTLLPMLKKYELVEEIGGKNYTRYQLTDTGKEIMRGMLWTCSNCDQTRECSRCWQGLEYNENDEHQLQGYECNNSGYESHDIRTCSRCDEFGKQLCYQCHGTKKCSYCV